jgi:hypothetical protein
MPLGFFFIQCLCFISCIDISTFFANFDTISQLDWSYDLSSSYDPVKDAIAQNAEAGTSSSNTNSTGGDPQPQGGQDHSADNRNNDTDTKRLGDYLSKCGEGNSVSNCNLEGSNPHSTPQTLFLSRIWAHVKAEHPEFANNYPYNPNTTVVNSTLLNNIYSLNKNYPGNWP